MTAQDNIATIALGLKYVNNRDFDAFLAMLVPNFKLQLILKPEMLQVHGDLSGHEGFRYYLNLLNTAFPDFVIFETAIRAHGNMVYQETLIRGQHLGEFVLPNGIKIPPTKLRVEIPSEVYHTFDQNGQFISSTGYASLIDVLKQFGR